MTDTYELPELPELPPLHPVPDWNLEIIKTFAQEYARLAAKAERERALAAVAALSTEARDREERDVIGRCWEAIRRAAAIRKG